MHYVLCDAEPHPVLTADDVADWTDDQAQNAVDLGWVCTDWLKGGALTQWSIPAAAIRVVVPLVPAQPTTWGKIKALYR